MNLGQVIDPEFVRERLRKAPECAAPAPLPPMGTVTRDANGMGGEPPVESPKARADESAADRVKKILDLAKVRMTSAEILEIADEFEAQQVSQAIAHLLREEAVDVDAQSGVRTYAIRGRHPAPVRPRPAAVLPVAAAKAVLKAPAGIVSTFSVLAAVGALESATSSEVVAHIGAKAENAGNLASASLQYLRGKGLIARHGDKRPYEYTLTEAGKARLRSVRS